MFRRAIAPHGQNTEEIERGFRTRAFYKVIVQERLEPSEVVRRICCPSSEEWFFPSVAVYGAFCNRGLKNVLSFMQASGSEEKEERAGCGRKRAWKGRRSFVICGEAGHKQGSQLPGLLIQHPQIKPGTGENSDGCTGKGVHFSAFSLTLLTTSGRSALFSHFLPLGFLRLVIRPFC